MGCKRAHGERIKTLVLERGRDVKHIKDYPTANKHPWEFEHRGRVPLEIQRQYSSRRGRVDESTVHFYVNDNEHPYIEEKPFTWTRGYQVGGKSLLWARQTQRWSDLDFEGPARDGYAIDWPIRYADLAPWYSYVEKFAGISGNKDGLQELPDGEFLPPTEMSCVDAHFQSQIAKNYKDRKLIQGRCAHITEPQPVHFEHGRTKCMHRTLCSRGCPLGGYFSSNASTIPWAAKTGNLTLRPHSVVHSIIFDKEKNKATGVRIIDAETKEMEEFYAKIIFVNASALNSNLVLLNSTSGRFPEGLGNDNGLLGKYIAWHNYRGKISADYEGLQDVTTDGRTPNHSYIPRFRNLHKQETDFLRGYAAGFGGGRRTLKSNVGIGETLKANLLKNTPGIWSVSAWMMGEVIPREFNTVSLDKHEKDQIWNSLVEDFC